MQFECAIGVNVSTDEDDLDDIRSIHSASVESINIVQLHSRYLANQVSNNNVAELVRANYNFFNHFKLFCDVSNYKVSIARDYYGDSIDTVHIDIPARTEIAQLSNVICHELLEQEVDSSYDDGYWKLVLLPIAQFNPQR